MTSTIFLASPASAAVIRSISVTGNRFIPAQAVSDYAGVTFGTNLGPSELNAILRRMYDSGLFENVELSVSGSTLNIKVIENPNVSAVAFEGNKDIKDKQLASIIKSSASAPYNRLTAEADAQRISNAYADKGSFGATVRPVIIPVSDGLVNLVFEVTESPVAGVTHIAFVGNSAFSDRRLRGVIKTNETNALSFLLGQDTLDSAKIATDRQKLKDYYANAGYFDFEILSSVPELSKDQSAVSLIFSLNEGFRYKFGESSMSSSINGVDVADFNKFVNLRKGRTYKLGDVTSIVGKIEAEAVHRGLPFLRVQPVYTKNEANRTIDVNFKLVNGRPVYVERIDISGNTGTRERVIRHQFDFSEGDAFNPRKLTRAADKLRALGIFGTVNVTVREGSSPDKAIVDVTVQEKATGSLGFAAGYSTDAGINGNISYSERNFLGNGQAINFKLSASGTTNTLSFSFAEPALFGRDVYASANGYYSQGSHPASSYQTTNAGFEPSVGFPLAEHTRLKLNYRLSMDTIRDAASNASPVIQGEQGSLLTSAAGAKLTYDRRNSLVEPTGGYVLSLNEQVAGLGGDVSYSKTVGRAKGYFSLFDNNLVMSAELEGGALVSGASGARVSDRFFLGGQSFKGFAAGGIGPRDSSTTANDALGGNYYGIMRLQSSFPLGFSPSTGIFGGVFVEGGSVWGLDNTYAGVDNSLNWRASSGVTLFWTTPIGPLEFNYAVPLLKESGDVVQNFSVSIGTRF